MQTTWPYAQECFQCGSWAWKQYTEKGKSSCFISAIYTVKCWNPPGLLYDLENHFAALAVVWEVCKQYQIEEAKDEESWMMISLYFKALEKGKGLA